MYIHIRMCVYMMHTNLNDIITSGYSIPLWKITIVDKQIMFIMCHHMYMYQ